MQRNGNVIFGFFIMLAIQCLISGFIGAWLWTYSINVWLVFLGKPAIMTLGKGFLLGLVPYLGYMCVPVAFVTFILMMFI